jgi:four helix bundle protein
MSGKSTGDKRMAQTGKRPHFRFEDLEIWQEGKQLAVELHQLSGVLENRRYYRYAEQLRAAGLSVPNNIAEGSASPHVNEFKQFLNIARRSLFENVSMLLVFEAMGLWEEGQIDGMLERCDILSRRITNYARSLERAKG